MPLLLPVEYERLRTTTGTDRRARPRPRQLAAGFEQRKYLAVCHTHVVRQAATEGETLKEVIQPKPSFDNREGDPQIRRAVPQVPCCENRPSSSRTRAKVSSQRASGSAATRASAVPLGSDESAYDLVPAHPFSQRANTRSHSSRQHAIVPSSTAPSCPRAQGFEHSGRRAVVFPYSNPRQLEQSSHSKLDAKCAWAPEYLSFASMFQPASTSERTMRGSFGSAPTPTRRGIRVGGSSLLQAKLIENEAGGFLRIENPGV